MVSLQPEWDFYHGVGCAKIRGTIQVWSPVTNPFSPSYFWSRCLVIAIETLTKTDVDRVSACEASDGNMNALGTRPHTIYVCLCLSKNLTLFSPYHETL